MPFSEQAIIKFEHGLISRGYGDKTRQSYRHLVGKFLGFVNDRFPDWKPFTDNGSDKLVVETYNRYMREEEQKKPASTNAALSAVARFFSIQGHSRHFKLQQAPVCARPDRLSDEQLQQLLDLLPDCSVKHQCIVTLFLTAGLRPQELRGLEISDLEIEKNRIQIRQPESQRFIPLTDASCQILRTWLLEREKIAVQTTAVFVNSNGLAISSAGLDFIVKTVGQRARIFLSARILRNTYIKWLLNSGQDLLSVVELAGLKNVASIWHHVSD